MNYKELMYMYNEIGAEGEGGVGFIKKTYTMYILCAIMCAICIVYYRNSTCIRCK